MIKIDLHAHTQICKQGDGKKRQISPKNFIDKMNKNNVGICAITNHNKFDIDEFNEITKLDPELTIFPGMEVDVRLYNNEHRHIILVVAPDKKIDFDNYFDENSRNYDDYIIEYQEFIDKIKKFKPKEILIIPHFYLKDKQRGITEKEAERLRKDLENYLVILEPKNLKAMGIINAHNDLSLFGSDVKDWNKYEEIILPEIKFKVDSFYKFYSLAQNPTLFTKNVLDGTQRYQITQSNESDKFVDLPSPVEILEDINIIFGEKGSGKTILINNYIYPTLKNLGKNVFKHEGKDYNVEYNNLKEELSNKVSINEEKLAEIRKQLELLLNYSEKTSYDSLSKLIEAHNSQLGNQRAKRIKKINSIYTQGANPEANVIVLSEAKDKFEKVESVKNINTSTKRDNNKKGILDKELELLKNDILNDTKVNLKNDFINKGIIKSIDSIKSSIKKQTGKESNPTHLGFSELVAKRLDKIKANVLLNIVLDEIKEVKVQDLGVIPKRGVIKLKTEISVLTENDYFNSNSPFDRNGIGERREMMQKLKAFSVSNDFRSVNEYFSAEQKSLNISDFIDKVIKCHSYTFIEDSSGNEKLHEPSEGEKAILSISGILENSQYDFYIFDEIERGLGNYYISDYLIPKIKELRDKGKTIVISTHNANIAINTLPSQTVFCNYDINERDKTYYCGNMYSNKLISNSDEKSWEEVALLHLEGSEEMFINRKEIYGV